MKQPFGWAYIGCGNICKSTARAIMKSGRHRIVSAYARSTEHAEAFARQFGGRACHDAQSAILAPEVEGVYIGTPHDSHLALATQALRLGKPVLVEKPGTVNASQWDALCQVAGEEGVYLCEAMWTRFSPTTQLVKQWVDEGRIGTPLGLEASFATWPKGAPLPQRLTSPALAGGVLLDMGIYPLTYAHLLFGMPQRLTCTGRLMESGVDAEEWMTLTYETGVQCRLMASVLHMRPPVAKLTGTKGSIRVPGFWFGKSALLRSGKRVQYRRPGGGYLFEFDKVAGDIRRGKLQSEEVPHHVTRELLELMDTCRAQLGVTYPFEGA